MKKIVLSFSFISGKGIISHKRIDPGEVVLLSSGVIRKGDKCTDFAIQIDSTSYLELYGEDSMYVNHSCDPNCYVDFSQIDRGKIIFKALKEIKEKDEITFNYNTTEYDMNYWNCSFNCQCGSINCIEEVKGFRFLDTINRNMIKLLLSPYLQEKYHQEKIRKKNNGEKTIFKKENQAF